MSGDSIKSKDATLELYDNLNLAIADRSEPEVAAIARALKHFVGPSDTFEQAERARGTELKLALAAEGHALVSIAAAVWSIGWKREAALEFAACIINQVYDSAANVKGKQP